MTPHHFTLIDEDVQYDSRYKMNPPLAAREDRDALLAGLADGTVDAIATDHAPHEPALKDVEFDRAPFGILGFETALAFRWNNWCTAGESPLMRIGGIVYDRTRASFGNGAAIDAGSAGGRDDFFDWTIRGLISVADSPSKSRNSPFDKRTFKGAPWRRSLADESCTRVVKHTTASSFRSNRFTMLRLDTACRLAAT